MSIELAEQYEEQEQYELALEEYKKSYEQKPITLLSKTSPN